MDAARSAPQGAHYHIDVIYLIKKRAMGLWYIGLGQRHLGPRLTFFIPRWTTNPCILYQGCDNRGACVLLFGHNAKRMPGYYT